MRAFRSLTPPRRVFQPPRAASNSATPPPSSSSSTSWPERSVSVRLKDKNNGSAMGKHDKPSTSISSSSIIENWQSSSLFDSLFPGDDSRSGQRRPIGRLDISEDSTYLPDPAEESMGGFSPRRLKRVSSVHWLPNSPSASRPAFAGGSHSTATSPKTIPDRADASIVILKGVGSTMLEADIKRLLQRGSKVPGYGISQGIVCITPNRHPRTLLQREGYNIVFYDAAAAKKFVYAKHPEHMLANPFTKSLKILPPASTPRFSLPVASAGSVRQDLRTLHGILHVGGCSPGSCVLLVASGLGGTTKETGRLPRTTEVRQMLEEADVRFCVRDQEEGSAGLQRIVLTRRTESGSRVVDRSFGTATGADAKWIVRCRDPSEAHRVVRDWNAREFPDGLGRFMAEMIY